MSNFPPHRIPKYPVNDDNAIYDSSREIEFGVSLDECIRRFVSNLWFITSDTLIESPNTTITKITAFDEFQLNVPYEIGYINMMHPDAHKYRDGTTRNMGGMIATTILTTVVNIQPRGLLYLYITKMVRDIPNGTAELGMAASYSGMTVYGDFSFSNLDHEVKLGGMRMRIVLDEDNVPNALLKSTLTGIMGTFDGFIINPIAYLCNRAINKPESVRRRLN